MYVHKRSQKSPSSAFNQDCGAEIAVSASYKTTPSNFSVWLCPALDQALEIQKKGGQIEIQSMANPRVRHSESQGFRHNGHWDKRPKCRSST